MAVNGVCGVKLGLRYGGKMAINYRCLMANGVMALRFALLLGLAMVLSGVNSPARAIEAGQTVTGSVQLGGVDLPLPAGEWTAYYMVQDEAGKFPLYKLGLVLIEGKAVKQAAYFRVSHSKTGAGFKPFDQCTLPHYFYSETVLNQIAGPQDCWHVHAETLAPDIESDRQKAITAFARSRGLFLPLVTIGPRYHRANQRLLVQASYGWTPDLIIKAPKDIKAWRFQDWTADEVAKEPRKKVVMSKFKRWGEEWRPEMDTAFTGYGSK